MSVFERGEVLRELDAGRIKKSRNTPEVDIRVVDVVQVDDTTGLQIKVLRAGPTGTEWAADAATRNSLLKRPSGAGTGGAGWTRTWQSGATETPDGDSYKAIIEILELASGKVLIFAQSHGDQIYRVLRSTDGTATAFTVVLTMDDTNRSIICDKSWCQATVTAGAITAGDIFIAENNDTLGPNDCHVWRSTDDGATWTTRSLISGIRHIHSIQIDPYNPGRLFACCGDNIDAGQSHWGFSDDAGATWTWVATSDGTNDGWQKSCVVALAFTTDYIYFGSDTNLIGARLFRVPRAHLDSAHIEEVRPNDVDGHVRNPIVTGGMILFPICATSGDAPNDNTRIVGSPEDDGINWNFTSWDWPRSHSTDDTAIFQVVAPIPGDANGDFWVLCTHLAGNEPFVGGGGNGISIRCRPRLVQPGDKKNVGLREGRISRAPASQRTFPVARTFSAPIASTSPFLFPLFRAEGAHLFGDGYITVAQAIDADAANFWTILVECRRANVRVRTLWQWVTSTLALPAGVPVIKTNTAASMASGDTAVLKLTSTGSPPDLVLPNFTGLVVRVNDWTS